MLFDTPLLYLDNFGNLTIKFLLCIVNKIYVMVDLFLFQDYK